MSKYDFTPGQAAVLAAYRALTLKERGDHAFAFELQSSSQNDYRSWVDSDQCKRERLQDIVDRKAQSDARKERQAELDATRTAWVIENVKPGMIIRVTGTKDGTGYRRVLSIDEWQVSCQTMTPTIPSHAEYKITKGTKRVLLGMRPYMSQHMLSKVIEYVDEQGVVQKVPTQ